MNECQMNCENGQKDKKKMKIFCVCLQGSLEEKAHREMWKIIINYETILFSYARKH
jgi:hypothetical protein